MTLVWSKDVAFGDRAMYTLQSEHVRGEARYYSVYVSHGEAPFIELINERSMSCSKAQAKRMAARYDTGDEEGMSVHRLVRNPRA